MTYHGIQNGRVRFGLVLTYRCNAKCRWCNRYLNWGSWEDSDLTPRDIRSGYNRVKRAGLEIEKTRVTGGEPLLHPQFSECMRVIGKTWNWEYIASGARTCVFTNGILPRPEPDGWRYNAGAQHESRAHQPPAISPADLGMRGACGTKKYCHRQRGCGRLFDVFGFSFCMFAGAIGRVVGHDPYGSDPVLDGQEEICKHCVFSVGVGEAHKLFKMAQSGEIEYPTKTYREAFERWGSEGAPTFPKFQER